MSIHRDLADHGERGLFAGRWLLLPVNVGLLVALAAYVAKFLAEDVHVVAQAFSMPVEDLLVPLLGLVDMAMVANLLVMIVQGGQQIFVRRFQLVDERARPQWLDHIDSGLLKLKVSLSIAGITLVRMLKDFAEIDRVDWQVVVHRGVIHALALLSALVMAVIWRITHPVAASDHNKEGSHT